MTKVAIAVFEILLALLTLASLGGGSEAAIEGTVCGEGSFAARASTKVVYIAIGNFDDGLLYHVLVGKDAEFQFRDALGRAVDDLLLGRKLILGLNLILHGGSRHRLLPCRTDRRASLTDDDLFAEVCRLPSKITSPPAKDLFERRPLQRSELHMVGVISI